MLQAAFGATVNLKNLTIVNGAGMNPLAMAAFADGRRAITLGDTVFINKNFYTNDLTGDAPGTYLISHEVTHVLQFQDYGFARVLSSIAAEEAVSGLSGEPYRYDHRPNIPFKRETFEGQGAIVGDYIRYMKFPGALPSSGDRSVTSSLLNFKISGSGIYGN